MNMPLNYQQLNQTQAGVTFGEGRVSWELAGSGGEMEVSSCVELGVFSLAAFIQAGAAGVVSVAFGEEQQVRMDLCLQPAPAFLERAVQLLGSRRHGRTCSGLIAWLP